MPRIAAILARGKAKRLPQSPCWPKRPSGKASSTSGREWLWIHWRVLEWGCLQISAVWQNLLWGWRCSLSVGDTQWPLVQCPSYVPEERTFGFGLMWTDWKSYLHLGTQQRIFVCRVSSRHYPDLPFSEVGLPQRCFWRPLRRPQNPGLLPDTWISQSVKQNYLVLTKQISENVCQTQQLRLW